MSNNKLVVEVMDGSNVWQDITADVMSIRSNTAVGLQAQRLNHPNAGRCDIVLNNSSNNNRGAKAYNPDVTAWVSALLENGRRVRVKGSGLSLNGYNILQVTHAGPYGQGGNITITASGGTSIVLGAPAGGIGIAQGAESFVPTVAGSLSAFTFQLAANTGTPAGKLNWFIVLDNGGTPTGQVMASGNMTPTPSAVNTVNLATPIQVQANQTYWLILCPDTSNAGGNSWNWQTSAANVYGSGTAARSGVLNSGVVWVNLPGNAQCSFTIGAINCYTFQTVSTGSVLNDVWVLQWDARAQFDSQYNQDLVELAFNNEGSGRQAYTYTNKWVTYTLSYTTAAATDSTIEARFWPNFNGPGLNSGLIEYRNITLKKNGGANVLLNGTFTVNSQPSTANWSTANVGSSTVTLGATNDYWTVFQGEIEDILPAPFINAGSLTSTVICLDYSADANFQTIDVALQQNQTSDQLASTLANLLPSGTLNTTLPGKQIDAGRATFQYAFDKYTKKTKLYDAMTDVVTSEYSRWWFDRDGTLRVTNRDFMGKRITTAAKLTVSDGMPFDMIVNRSRKTLIDRVELTYTPRQLGGSVQPLGQIQQPVSLPPATGNPVTAINVSGANLPIGNNGGTTYQQAESFKLSTGGQLVQLAIWHNANVGAPSGTVTWQIQTDNAGVPSGVVVASGTYTPTASFNNNVPVSGGPNLSANTTYWLVLFSTGAQTSGNYWQWRSTTTHPYKNGNTANSTNGGSTWNAVAVSNANCAIIIATNSNTTIVASGSQLTIGNNGGVTSQQAESFQCQAGLLTQIVVQHAANVGAPTGTITWQIQTDNGGTPSGTVLISGTYTPVASSGNTITVPQTPGVNLNNNTTYWLVLFSTNAQTSGNYWQWQSASSQVYLQGNTANSTNGGSTWTPVVASNAQCQITIQANGLAGTVTVNVNFRDATGNTIGGVNCIPPVANTDYKIWDHQNGTGIDVTLAVQVTSFILNGQSGNTPGASTATITFFNPYPTTFYITMLQVRGTPLYKYDPVTVTKTNSDSVSQYKLRDFPKDLPFTNDPNFVDSLAQYYVNQYGSPFLEVQQLTVSNKAVLNTVDLLSLELFDVVDVSDVQAGLSHVKHVIVALSYELDPNGTDYVTNFMALLERLDQQTYWVLGDAAYGLLDQTTYLYI